MDVPTYSLAERDRRWALAREITAAEQVEALIAYGGHECTGMAAFAPDAYFSNDQPGSIVIFCHDADPVQLVWSNLPVQAPSPPGCSALRAHARPITPLSTEERHDPDQGRRLAAIAANRRWAMTRERRSP